MWYCLKPFEAVMLAFNRFESIEANYGYNSWNVFNKNLNLFSTEDRNTEILLDDMGLSKLSGHFKLNVN